MVHQQKAPALSEMLKNEVRAFTAASLAILILAGLTHSNPIEPPSSVDQIPEYIHPGSVPAELLGRYLGNPYMEEEASDIIQKRNPILRQITQREIDEDKEFPRYLEKRSKSPGGYWNLVKALEEELALEAMARERLGAEEREANEVETPNDVHQVNKRRRRYGFWATAINKMDGGHLRGFLAKHKNIYNVYKRAALNPKWLPRASF